MKITLTLFFLLSAFGCLSGQTGLNEKSATPAGYGEKHYIEQNTDITYRIRFQNIGTDTAFNLKIRDTLSVYLDVNSIRPGESSHDYELEIEDGRTIALRFPSIKLPGNDMNKEDSKGYVTFTVSQMPDVPLETKIVNSAAIFFDFNDPIFTNEYYHTVGKDFLPNSTVTVLKPGLEVNVFPNPVSDFAKFDLGNARFSSGQIQFFDGAGQLATSTFFDQARFQFNREGLPSGLYFFKIDIDGEHVASGQLLFH